MKRLIFLVLLFSLLFSSVAYGEINNEYIDYSNERMILDPKNPDDSLPYWYRIKDPADGRIKTAYLFVVTEEERREIVYYSLDAQGNKINEVKYEGETGQYCYFWNIDNNGDPYDVTPLKDKNNFIKLFDIAFHRNYNGYGMSFVNVLHFDYFIRVPAEIIAGSPISTMVKNYTSDVYTKIVDKLRNADPKKFFFTAPAKYVKTSQFTGQDVPVNPRKNIARDGTEVDFIFFPVDCLADPDEGYSLNKNYYPDPHINGRDNGRQIPVSEGYYNKVFFADFKRNNNKASFNYILAYYAFCSAYPEGYNGGSLDENITKRMMPKLQAEGIVPKDISPEDLINWKVYTFFRFWEVHTLPNYYSFGDASGKHRSTTKDWGVSLRAPRVENTDYKNIRIASPEYPIGNYNSMTVYRVLEDGTLVEVKEGDKLKVLEPIVIDTYMSFEGYKRQGGEGGANATYIDVETYFKPIFANLMFYYNGNMLRNGYGDATQLTALTPDKKELSGIQITKVTSDEDLQNLNLRNTGILQSATKSFDKTKGFEDSEIKEDGVYKIRYFTKVGTPKKTDNGLTYLVNSYLGEEINKIQWRVNLPWETKFYQDQNVDRNDNQVRADDYIESPVFEVLPNNNINNTWMGYDAATPTREEIKADKVYDRVIVEVKNEVGIMTELPQLEHEVSVNQGDNTTLKVYIKRAEEVDSNGRTLEQINPIMFKDIQLKMNETVNGQIKGLDSKETYSLYKSGYVNNNKASVTKMRVSRRGADGNYGTFMDVNMNDFIKQGDIVEFTAQYKVPTLQELTNPSADSVYDKLKFLGADLQKLCVSFELSFRGYQQDIDFINSNKDDDWAKVILNTGDQKLRNIKLYSVLVKDEAGTTVAKVNPDGTTTYYNRLLDPRKNYYAEVQSQFLYPVLNGQSINAALKTSVAINYDGLITNNTEDSKNHVVSELTNRWNNGQIGTYKTKSNVSSYDPASSPYDPMVIPLKKKPTVSTISVTVKIPDIYNDTDNQLHNDLEKVILTFDVNRGISVDNAVTSIRLFDTSGKEYNTPNPDGITYVLDASKQYYADITVERLSGDGLLLSPELKIEYSVIDDDGFTTKILTTAKSLTKRGDKIVYRLSGLVSNYGFIRIDAKFEYEDINMSNNAMSKTWQCIYDFAIADFDVRPDILTMQQNQNYIDSKASFSATLTYKSYGMGNNAEEVPVVVLYGSKIVWQDTVDFRNRVPQNIGFTLNDGQSLRFYEGNNLFTIKINGGHSGARKYVEKSPSVNPYDNNEKSDYLNVKKVQPNQEMVACSYYNKVNNWSTTFDMFKQTGSLKSGRVTRCNKSGCREVTITWCEDVETEDWTETRNYYERFRIDSVMFRSQYTIDKYGGQGWINVLGNQNGIVRAGQWFEFYVVTRFETNRNNMPAEWRRNKCNFQTRNPDVSPIYEAAPYISLRLSGYGPTETYPILTHYSSQGSWYNHSRYYKLPDRPDIFGETNTRRYLPKDGKNGTLNLTIITKEFRGQESDDSHPRKLLQDCVTSNAKIYIKGPLNNQSQIIGH